MKSVSIIIPVYSGMSELDMCIKSVIKSKNNLYYNVILIDDNPDNKDVGEKLIDYERKYSNVVVLRNKKNLGFSSSINKGIIWAKGDVIILNSDTVVPDGFVDMLDELSRMSDSVGTISTLTNKGTILSVPSYCKDTDFTSDFDVNGYQNKIISILPKISKNKQNWIPMEKIPTPVGHCMWIGRNIIDSVGLFDSKTFGRGYGEENDYGERVKKAGFNNFVALNVFIQHKGSTSFRKSKINLIEKHTKIINKRYPFHKWNRRLYKFSNNSVRKICYYLNK